MTIFTTLSLVNKLWVKEDALATAAWAFLVLWAAAECLKNWKRNMATYAIDVILFIGTFAVLVFDISDFIK